MRRHLLLAAVLAAAACATLSPRAPAPPTAAIEVRPIRGTERFRVETRGLEPEIAVESVEEADLPLARDLAAATVAALQQPQPAPGLVLDVQLGRATSRVQLVSAAGQGLLIVDVPPTAARVRPFKALATAAWARGEAAWDEGDAQAARQWLQTSVRLFPGDPLEAEARDLPPEANQQNYLAWASLAHLADGAEAERWYVGALERSRQYLAHELGGTPDELIAVEHPELFETARVLVDRNFTLAAPPRRPAGAGGPVEVPSPIGPSEGPREQVILPEEMVAFWAAEPGASLLRRDAFLALAVDAFERLRTDPVELLLATREIRSIYLREDPLAVQPPAAAPTDKMLSALILDVARKAAAGLDELEIAATLGDDAPPRILATARAKLVQRREREAAWYSAALR